MARIVEVYGDAYWPLFDRLDRELRQRWTREDRLARCRSQLSEPANDEGNEGTKLSSTTRR